MRVSDSGYLRRTRAVRLLELVFDTTGMGETTMADALVTTSAGLRAYRSGSERMPLDRQLCLALYVIEHLPSLAPRAHALRAQVAAEIAFNARLSQSGGQFPIDEFRPRAF
jgi:hypothetical protein